MAFKRNVVNVIGCGFAGIETALFLADRGINVNIFDGSISYPNLEEGKNKFLKEEIYALGSPLAAREVELLDQGFDGNLPEELLKFGLEKVKKHKKIQYYNMVATEIHPYEITVIATGPRTDEKLFSFLTGLFGSMRCLSHLPVYPIVDYVDEDKIYRKNDNEFLIPFTYEQYISFLNRVIDKINVLNEDDKFKIVDNTFESYVLKGKDFLRNYFMTPQTTDEIKFQPYATMKLVKKSNGYEIAGFSSKVPAYIQEEIFNGVEPLRKAKLIRAASTVEGSFVNAKYMVNEFCQSRSQENIFFAGGVLGLDGYVEAQASGLITAMNVYKFIQEKNMILPPKSSMLGRMARRLMKSTSAKAEQIIKEEDLLDGLPDLGVEEKKHLIERFKEDYNNGK